MGDSIGWKPLVHYAVASSLPVHGDSSERSLDNPENNVAFKPSSGVFQVSNPCVGPWMPREGPIKYGGLSDNAMNLRQPGQACPLSFGFRAAHGPVPLEPEAERGRYSISASLPGFPR